eukprot:1157730-Pelagomonas_calceolata.AAC.7
MAFDVQVFEARNDHVVMGCADGICCVTLSLNGARTTRAKEFALQNVKPKMIDAATGHAGGTCCATYSPDEVRQVRWCLVHSAQSRLGEAEYKPFSQLETMVSADHTPPQRVETCHSQTQRVEAAQTCLTEVKKSEIKQPHVMVGHTCGFCYVIFSPVEVRQGKQH